MKVFIGSSSESLPHARRTVRLLRELGHQPLLWKTPGLFRVNKPHVADLERIAGDVDAAVFVFGEDDQVIVRDEEKPAVRANVLFEYGLFSGRLGSGRTCIVLVGSPYLASDFSGIKHVMLSDKNAREELANWLKETGPKPLPLPEIDLRQSLGASLNSLLLEQAKSSLFISGVNNLVLMGLKADLLRRSADVSIRLLMTDLQDKPLQRYYKDLRSSKTDPEDTAGLMASLAGADTEKPIEIRVAGFMMPAFFVAADLPAQPDDPSSGVILAFHTLTDTQSSQRPSVMLTPQHGSWFERYRTQIEHIWERAAPFQAPPTQ